MISLAAQSLGWFEEDLLKAGFPHRRRINEGEARHKLCCQEKSGTGQDKRCLYIIAHKVTNTHK